MNALLPLAALAGLALLAAGWSRERRRRLDALAALDVLERHDPVRVPPYFLGSMTAGALGAVLGMPGTDAAGRLVVAAAFVLVPWFVWVGTWSSYRRLVDASVVFQDHVPLECKPERAYEPVRELAIGYRPLAAALLLLASLVSGVVMATGVAALVGAWSSRLTVALWGWWTAVGAYFMWRVYRASRTELELRAALGRLDEAPTDLVYRALRTNPRSRGLLEAHADRLAGAGYATQALIEYRAARLRARRDTGLAAKIDSVRDDAEAAHAAEPEGALVREPYAPAPALLLEPLEMAADAVAVRVLDADAFVRTLLATPGDGLVVEVSGRLDEPTRERLRGHEYRVPRLLPPAFGEPQTYRVDEETARALGTWLDEHDVECEWEGMHLFSERELLVEAHRRFSDARVARAFLGEVHDELRRAAAIAAVRWGEGAEEPPADEAPDRTSTEEDA